MRRCATCGKPLPSDALRTRKYCDATCRVNFSRGHLPGPVAEVVALETPEPDGDHPAELTLEEIAAELRRTLHRSDTPASAKAGISKELRAVMAEIAKAKPVAKSMIDQLAERRAQRTGS
jgi:hypothetical protein